VNTDDLVSRLRDRSYAFKARDPLVEEAADEIERLRSLTRFQDRVACLTEGEREAVEWCIFQQATPQRVAVILRELVERMK
jgi:hypothetical protein